MKTIGWILISAGAALTALNLAGLLISPDFASGRPTGSNSIPGYHYLTDHTEALDSLLAGPADNFILEDATGKVFQSIIHTSGRRITIFENWLLYIAGLVYPPAGKTQLAGRIAAGRGGNCSEASAVMIRIAEINGLEARFVALGGHVVAEVLTGQGWRVADPDYGVTFDAGIGELQQESSAAAIMEAVSRRGYADSVIARYVDYYQSVDNNTVLEPGVPPSPDLYRMERAAEWIKWLIPLFFLAAGIFLVRKEK